MTKNGRSNAMRRMPYKASFAYYEIASIKQKTDQFERYLDKKIKEVEKKKMKKEECEEYLKSIVDEHITRLKSELDGKHYASCGNIRDAFVGRTADRRELKQIADSLGEKIVETKEELELIKQLYKGFSPMSREELHETPDEKGEF